MDFLQLPLGIRLKDSASFVNYFEGRNRQALAHVRACARGEGESVVYLWGHAGSGKTHLLQAACHEAASCDSSTVYLPLRDAPQWSPEIMTGMEECALICLDDLDAIAGNALWEEAVFHLYNRVRDRGHRILMSANAPIAEVKLQLRDLASRVAWGLVLRVESLDEAEKIAALQQRASLRGFELPDDVAQFLLRHCPRDTTSLFELLDRLDDASLAAQRKLTIPFVRGLI